jgi:hypothetical protein
MSLHPSEKVALVGCGDRRIRMWDLMKATCMFTTKQFEEDVEVRGEPFKPLCVRERV